MTTLLWATAIIMAARGLWLGGGYLCRRLRGALGEGENERRYGAAPSELCPRR